MIPLALSSIAEMFGLFFLGWLAQRAGILDRTTIGKIAPLVYDFLMPALIIHSVITGLDLSRVNELWWLPLLGIGFMLLGFLLGLVLRYGVRSKTPGVRRVFHHICAINNYGFLPIFIIQNALTPEALALFFVFNLGSTAGYWTIGILSLGETPDTRTALRKLISAPLVSLVIAMVLAFAHAESWMPGFLLRTAEKAGSIAVPLILVCIGASLSGSLRREWAWDLAWVSISRLILIPLIIIGLVHLLPLAPDIRTICIIVALMPATANAVLLTKVYGGSTEFAAAAILVTTLGSAITIPLGIYLFL